MELGHARPTLWKEARVPLFFRKSSALTPLFIDICQHDCFWFRFNHTGKGFPVPDQHQLSMICPCRLELLTPQLSALQLRPEDFTSALALIEWMSFWITIVGLATPSMTHIKPPPGLIDQALIKPRRNRDHISELRIVSPAPHQAQNQPQFSARTKKTSSAS